jgi:hypothetical protein
MREHASLTVPNREEMIGDVPFLFPLYSEPSLESLAFSISL